MCICGWVFKNSSLTSSGETRVTFVSHNRRKPLKTMLIIKLTCRLAGIVRSQANICRNKSYHDLLIYTYIVASKLLWLFLLVICEYPYLARHTVARAIGSLVRSQSLPPEKKLLHIILILVAIFFGTYRLRTPFIPWILHLFQSQKMKRSSTQLKRPFFQN